MQFGKPEFPFDPSSTQTGQYLFNNSAMGSGTSAALGFSPSQCAPSNTKHTQPQGARSSYLCFWWMGCCLMAMYCVSSCKRFSGDSGFRRIP